ncbi:MAG: B-box zinc finger protein [Dehalococcoidia bacterium]|nr:B-box zinc finger protein [Dehalococcoidia bacterium]
MKCAAHPNIETNLRCGKCGKPICPKCLVQTPVGARCPECARVQRPVTYQVPARFYVRALGAGLATGFVSGIVWALVPLAGFFLFIIAAGIGFLIGEAISRSVNLKRGLGLQIIAGISMAVSYVAQSWASEWISLPLQPWVFMNLFDLYGIIALVVGVAVAVSRLH